MMSEKRLIFGAQLFFILASFFLTASGFTADSLTVEVVLDFSTMSWVDIDGSGGPPAPANFPTPGEPFLIQGDIFQKDTNNRIGTFLCRGFFITPQDDGDFSFVHQSFEIDGMGTIHVEGNEPGAVPGIEGFSRAVVGATGSFEGAAAQAAVVNTETGFLITFIFEEGTLTSVSSPADESRAKTFRLSQNYPNPFNPSTTIEYQLSELGHVALRIFNLKGQEVRTLLNGPLPAGEYSLQWDGKDNQGQAVASGTYLYRLETKDFMKAQKMLLVH